MHDDQPSTHRLRESFAARIDALGLTKTEAARRSLTTPSKLVQYLKGRTNPPINVMCRLADGLGCELVLIERDEP